MIVTKLEKINVISVPSAVRIVNAYTSPKGAIFYEYEFDLHILTDKIFSENLTEIKIDAYDVIPKGILDASLLLKRDINFDKGDTRMLSSIGTSTETNRSNLQGSLSVQDINLNVKQDGKRKIVNTDTLGQNKILINGNQAIDLGNRNYAIKNAILNFGQALSSGPIRKTKIKTIATDNISIFSSIDSKFRDTVRASSAGTSNSKKIKRKKNRRGTRTPSIESSLNTSVNTSYVLDSFELSMIPVKHKKIKSGNNRAYLTTVINYRKKNAIIPSQNPNIFNYERGSGQSVIPQQAGNAGSLPNSLPNTKRITPTDVSGPDTQVGYTLFTKNFKEACRRAVYEYGIPPTTLSTVSTESTIVSPMQNYQGTSKIRSNGY